MPLTVFVGTYNRLDTLARTVKSYEGLSTPLELVIVDNGTDNHTCQTLLGVLEGHPLVRRVMTLPSATTMDGLTDNFLAAMKDYPRKERDWFAVSEADICFDGSHPDTIDRYLALAKHTGQAVGAHLRVTDIPAGYPLRSRVLTTETRFVYERAMQWFYDIPYSPCQIDTTFHLFPADREFRRLYMNPLRVGPPFDAMHLDWYLDIAKPTAESKVYVRKDEGHQVGSWGKNWIADYWRTYQTKGAEKALGALLRAPRNGEGDLCVTAFMLAWAYQYGVGVEADRDESERWLRAAIPRKFIDYWKQDRGVYGGDEGLMWSDWLQMVYNDDYTCLGWPA